MGSNDMRWVRLVVSVVVAAALLGVVAGCGRRGLRHDSFLGEPQHALAAEEYLRAYLGELSERPTLTEDEQDLVDIVEKRGWANLSVCFSDSGREPDGLFVANLLSAHPHYNCADIKMREWQVGDEWEYEYEVLEIVILVDPDTIEEHSGPSAEDQPRAPLPEEANETP